MKIDTVLCEVKAIGRKELVNHLRGKKLTYKEALLAQCYDCMGGYVDGKRSCNLHKCPLYPFMPYRKVEKSDSQGMQDPAF